MDPERADYFDYDNPPDRDWRLSWRAASAVAGFIALAALVAVFGLVGFVALRDPPAVQP